MSLILKYSAALMYAACAERAIIISGLRTPRLWGQKDQERVLLARSTIYILYIMYTIRP
jgi:hypothetical protein